MDRKSKGHQKIEMIKMSNEINLQVTFSKRRAGLFKKASERSTLCGVDIAIIIFFPRKKDFSFGHPCVEKVIEDFICGNPPRDTSGAMTLIEVHRNSRIHELNMILTRVMNQLEIEKNRNAELKEIQKICESKCWWMGPKQEMRFSQLEHLKTSLEELKKKVTKEAEMIII
ncbi:agamous-like MADS-box protein AGL62 [Carica papaya]|uniref:agamous-like MADS-box protein AGL62 n=1 Tax=Carica papaya TaxID=3649 RepID=UPI000B8CEAF4|nr:agamous-like MADS-box protein AGL62 [Carica papaya]